MRYCRFSEESDVYMHANMFGGITCCSCLLNLVEGGIFNRSQCFLSPHTALDHLQEHAEAGHLVPQYAIDQLKQEIRDTKEEEYATPEEVERFYSLLDDLLLWVNE